MILYQLTTDGDLDKLVHISEHIPFLENALVISGAHAFDDVPPPRIFKTHLTYQGVPKGPCKYVYVARNGKDVLVSSYHHEVSGRGDKGTFAEFADRFMRGRLPQGSWFAHVAGWYKHKDDPNVL